MPWPHGTTGMAARMRAFDWAATPLGPIHRWPQSLKTIVDLMLASPGMMSLVWGVEAIHLYNDAFTELLREHHDQALGTSAFRTFARSRATFEADIARGLSGQSAHLPAQRYPVLRNGRLEDAWFDVDYIPVRDDTGRVAGVLWLLKETTAQVVAERALRERDARQRLLIESWAQAEWETDPDGRVVADSPSWRAQTGQTMEEWLGRGWLDAIHPDDRAAIERQWRDALSTCGLVDAEARLRCRDGGWRWTNLRAAPVIDADGCVEKWVGMNIDIHARKHAEETLRASEARLRGVLDGMTEGFGLLASDFTILDQNAEALRLDGRPRDRIVGRSYWDVYPGREQSDVGRLLKRAMAERVSLSNEHHFEREDGRATWLDMRAYPAPDGGLAVFWRDVTDRRAAETALRASETKYRALFESMDEAYAVIEVLKDACGAWTDFRFVEVNPAFVGHTAMPWPVGQTATELLGRPNPRWTELYGQALDTGMPIRVEESEPTLDRVFDLNIFVLDRERNRVAVLFSNITERKRAEAALRESEELRRVALEGGRMGAWTWNTRERWVRADHAFQQLWGVAFGARTHPVSAYIERMDAAGAAALEAVMAAEVAPGQIVEDQVRVTVGPSAGRWVQWRGRADQERPWIIHGVSFDVTERHEWAERQKVLLAELQHRVRNILALIRSVVSRSDDGERSATDYVQHLQGRLSALARTQVLLTRRASAGIQLEDMIREELLAQVASERQFTLTGPDVELAPKAAEVLTLAIHELATNATKYGAFSRASGRLTVAWQVERKDGQRWLSLIWTERGVPIVDAVPRRQGFGSELISRRIPYELKGSGSFVLKPGGLESRIAFPLRSGDSILQTHQARCDTVERDPAPLS